MHKFGVKERTDARIMGSKVAWLCYEMKMISGNPKDLWIDFAAQNTIVFSLESIKQNRE